MADPTMVVKSQALGSGIRPIGLSSVPPRLRGLCNEEWERLFGEGSDFYTRVPLSGCALDEYLCSSSEPWGASRPNLFLDTSAPPPDLIRINQLDIDVPPQQEYWQRWNFMHDFECYGLTIPLQEYDSGTIRMKFGLFQMFPFTNTTQAWKILEGATFKIDHAPTTGQSRKLFVPPDPSNGGTLVIPAGLYYLAIYPGADLEASFFGRYPRDYTDDGSNLWRADRVRTNTSTDWSTWNFADVVFDNDGTAPPVASGMTAIPPDDDNAYPYPRIDFGFYGRFVG